VEINEFFLDFDRSAVYLIVGGHAGATSKNLKIATKARL
jgi:hypothetical protein